MFGMTAGKAGVVALVLGMGATLFAQAPDSQPASAPEAGGHGRRGGMTFEQLDTNGDGKITQDEFHGPADFFTRADTNKDGVVTKDEFDAFRQQLAGDASSRPQGVRGGFGGANGFAGIQQMMMDRLKTRLGASDDEWKVLEPKVQVVMDMQMKTRISGMSGLFGRGGRSRGGQGGPGGATDQAGQAGRGGPGGPGGMFANASMPEADALNAAVDDANTPADKLAAALQAYRDARKKAQADLAAAQADLVKVLTPRQEAVLVASGLLD